MDKSKDNELELLRISNKIDELREILNDICITLEENESSSLKLMISKHLDELIVEYMTKINKVK